MVECTTDLDVIRRMSPEELVEWVLWEPEPTPLKSLPLDTDEGRQAFLREVYMIGPDAMFQAVVHIWSCLAEPKLARCVSIAAAAETAGSGKGALLAVLNKFMGEALKIEHPLPPRDAFEDLDSWHLACMATFQDDEKELDRLVSRYSEVLNADPFV